MIHIILIIEFNSRYFRWWRKGRILRSRSQGRSIQDWNPNQQVYKARRPSKSIHSALNTLRYFLQTAIDWITKLYRVKDMSVLQDNDVEDGEQYKFVTASSDGTLNVYKLTTNQVSLAVASSTCTCIACTVLPSMLQVLQS